VGAYCLKNHERIVALGIYSSDGSSDLYNSGNNGLHLKNWKDTEYG
jgi:hypothetical protein